MPSDPKRLNLHGSVGRKQCLQDRQSKLVNAIKPGMAMEVGIRPEHLEIVPVGTKGAMEVRVSVVGWLGHEVFIFGRTSFGPIGVRVPEDMAAAPSANDVLSIRPIADRWHLFDAVSGDNLLPNEEPAGNA